MRLASILGAYEELEYAHQIENALGMVFVFGTLCIKQETLAGLSRVSGIPMGNVFRFFIANVGREVLVLKGAVAEPEILLCRDQTSDSHMC